MDRKIIKTILVVIVLLFLGAIIILPILVSNYIQSSTQSALSPILQANQQLKTQVSQLLNPTPTILPDPITIIHEVRSLARLETLQYSVEKIITADSGQGDWSFLFGDKLIFVAHGRVIAGIDLEKIQTKDIRFEKDVLHIKLPQAELFSVALDNEKSYVYDRETGIFTTGNMNLETLARQSAEEEIRKAALEDGILEQAKMNGENFLIRLMRSLGYDKVVFD
jgi:hypothetical protein